MSDFSKIETKELLRASRIGITSNIINIITQEIPITYVKVSEDLFWSSSLKSIAKESMNMPVIPRANLRIVQTHTTIVIFLSELRALVDL